MCVYLSIDLRLIKLVIHDTPNWLPNLDIWKYAYEDSRSTTLHSVQERELYTIPPSNLKKITSLYGPKKNLPGAMGIKQER